MRQQIFEDALKKIVADVDSAYATLPKIPDTLAEMGLVERVRILADSSQTFAQLTDSIREIAEEALRRDH